VTYCILDGILPCIISKSYDKLREWLAVYKHIFLIFISFYRSISHGNFISKFGCYHATAFLPLELVLKLLLARQYDSTSHASSFFQVEPMKIFLLYCLPTGPIILRIFWYKCLCSWLYFGIVFRKANHGIVTVQIVWTKREFLQMNQERRNLYRKIPRTRSPVPPPFWITKQHSNKILLVQFGDGRKPGWWCFERQADLYWNS